MHHKIFEILLGQLSLDHLASIALNFLRQKSGALRAKSLKQFRCLNPAQRTPLILLTTRTVGF